MIPTRSQSAAVEAVGEGVTVLVGEANGGRTATLAAVALRLARDGLKVTVCAPAGGLDAMRKALLEGASLPRRNAARLDGDEAAAYVDTILSAPAKAAALVDAAKALRHAGEGTFAVRDLALTPGDFLHVDLAHVREVDALRRTFADRHGPWKDRPLARYVEDPYEGVERAARSVATMRTVVVDALAVLAAAPEGMEAPSTVAECAARVPEGPYPPERLAQARAIVDRFGTVDDGLARAMSRYVDASVAALVTGGRGGDVEALKEFLEGRAFLDGADAGDVFTERLVADRLRAAHAGEALARSGLAREGMPDARGLIALVANVGNLAATAEEMEAIEAAHGGEVERLRASVEAHEAELLRHFGRVPTDDLQETLELASKAFDHLRQGAFARVRDRQGRQDAKALMRRLGLLDGADPEVALVHLMHHQRRSLDLVEAGEASLAGQRDVESALDGLGDALAGAGFLAARSWVAQADAGTLRAIADALSGVEAQATQGVPLAMSAAIAVTGRSDALLVGEVLEACEVRAALNAAREELGSDDGNLAFLDDVPLGVRALADHAELRSPEGVSTAEAYADARSRTRAIADRVAEWRREAPACLSSLVGLPLDTGSLRVLDDVDALEDFARHAVALEGLTPALRTLADAMEAVPDPEAALEEFARRVTFLAAYAEASERSPDVPVALADLAPSAALDYALDAVFEPLKARDVGFRMMVVGESPAITVVTDVEMTTIPLGDSHAVVVDDADETQEGLLERVADTSHGTVVVLGCLDFEGIAEDLASAMRKRDHAVRVVRLDPDGVRQTLRASNAVGTFGGDRVRAACALAIDHAKLAVASAPSSLGSIGLLRRDTLGPAYDLALEEVDPDREIRSVLVGKGGALVAYDPLALRRRVDFAVIASEGGDWDRVALAHADGGALLVVDGSVVAYGRTGPKGVTGDAFEGCVEASVASGSEAMKGARRWLVDVLAVDGFIQTTRTDQRPAPAHA